MKRFVVFSILFLIVTGFAVSQTLTKVGIINISKIVQSYYAESRAWREIEEETKKAEEYIAEKMNQLNNLRARKLSAENTGDQSQVLRLDEEIFRLQEHIQEYRNIKYNQIKTKRDRLLQSPDFASELQRGINYISENEGFTLIINSDSRDILWWSPEVDITDKVLGYLRATSRRN